MYENQKITFPNTNYCIITIPFSRSLTDPFDYPNSLKNLIHQLPIQHYERILFTSSTSIYKPNNSLITKTDELDTTKRALALSAAEQTILTASNKSIVLRLSGICGYSRNSMPKLTSPTIDDSNLPVNLIHVDDIIKVMSNLLITDEILTSDIINVTSSKHPTKQAYYEYLCKLFKITPPTFKESNKSFKKVSNQKLLETYKIDLQFKSPLEFTF